MSDLEKLYTQARSEANDYYSDDAVDARAAAAAEAKKPAEPKQVYRDMGNYGAPMQEVKPPEPDQFTVTQGGKKYDMERRDDGVYVLGRDGETLPEPLSIGEDLPAGTYSDDDIRPDLAMAMRMTTEWFGNNIGTRAGLGFFEAIGNMVRTAAETTEAAGIAPEASKNVQEGMKMILDAKNEAIAKQDAEAPLAVMVPNKVAEIGGQFVAPAAGIYKVMRAAKYGPVAASIFADALVGYAGIAPEDPNISNLIPEGGDVFSAIEGDEVAFGALKDLAATDPNDPNYVNRLRNMGEALVTLGVGEMAVRGIMKTIEGGQRVASGLESSGLADQFGEKVKEFWKDESGQLNLVSDPPIIKAEDASQKELPGLEGSRLPVVEGEGEGPIFFSAVEQAIRDLPMEKGSGMQMYNMIKKTAGVKDEELYWLDLESFAKENPKLTKEELLNYAKTNRVIVRENERSQAALQRGDMIPSDGDGSINYDEMYESYDYQDDVSRAFSSELTDQVRFSGTGYTEPAEHLREAKGEELRGDIEAYPEDYTDDEEIIAAIHNGDYDAAEKLLQEELDKLQDDGMFDVEEYSNNLGYYYSRPVHDEFSSDDVMIVTPDGDTIEAGWRSSGDDEVYDHFMNNNDVSDEELLQEWNEQALLDIQEEYRKPEIDPEPKWKHLTQPGGENYKELTFVLDDKVGARHLKDTFTEPNHFEEPNFVVHARISDRVDTEGNKTLFVEEVQSDWHKRGLEGGYSDPEAAAKIDSELSDLNYEIGELWDGYSLTEAITEAWNGNTWFDLEGVDLDDIQKLRDKEGIAAWAQITSDDPELIGKIVNDRADIDAKFDAARQDVHDKYKAMRDAADEASGEPSGEDELTRMVRDIVGENDTIQDDYFNELSYLSQSHAEEMQEIGEKYGVELNSRDFIDAVSIQKALDRVLGAIGRDVDLTGKAKELADRKLVIDVKRNQIENRRQALRKVRGGVPKAPFKNTWHELAMKRLLRMAIDGDYDQIAWSNSSQQIKINSVGSVVDRIDYLKTSGENDGMVTLKFEKDGNLIDIDGRTARDNGLKSLGDNQYSIALDDLEKLVGRAPANRIRAGETKGSLTGEGLQVGGAGYREIYDDRLRRWARDAGKKFGQNVEVKEYNFSANDKERFEIVHAAGPHEGNRYYWRTYETKEEAESSIDSMISSATERGQEDEISAYKNLVVRSIPPEIKLDKNFTLKINDDMRKTLRRTGLPLFQAAGAAAGGTALMAPGEAQAEDRIQVASAGGDVLGQASKIMRAATKEGNIVPDEVVSSMRKAIEEGDTALEGIDFNIDHIEDGEQLGEYLNIISEQFADTIDKKKRGKQTFDMTEEKAELARLTGFNEEDILRRADGELWNAEKMLAARQILVKNMKGLEDLGRRIKAGEDTTENLVLFRRKLAVTAALQFQIKGAQTEVGRALSQFRIMAKTPMEKQVVMADLLQSHGGPEAQMRSIDAYLDLVDSGDQQKAAAFARNAFEVKGVDMLFEAWINSLLGSPKTHMVNAASNAALVVTRSYERWLSAVVGEASAKIGLEAGPGVTFAEARAQTWGTLLGLVDGFKAAGSTFRHGVQSDDFGKIDMRNRAITPENINQLPTAKAVARLRDRAMGRPTSMSPELLRSGGGPARFVDWIAENYYRAPGRFLITADEFFRAVNYRSELHAQAARYVKQNGLTGQDAADFYNDLMADPQMYPEIHLKAAEAGKEGTLTMAPGNVAGPLQKSISNAKIANFPAGRVVVPFFNVINNIMKHAAERIPGQPLVSPGPGRKSMTELTGKDPAARQMVIGKQIAGATYLSMGAMLAYEGTCTGRLSDNPRQLQTLRAQGKEPYSCTIGGKSYSYNRLDPLGMFLAVGADTMTALTYTENPEEREALVTAAMAAVSPYMMDKSFAQGISDLFEAISPKYAQDESRVTEAGKYLSRLASTFPGALLGPAAPGSPMMGAVEDYVDPTVRTTRPDPNESPEMRIWESMVNKIFGNTPGLSKDLPPVLNLWGEEVTLPGGLAESMIIPTYINELPYTKERLEDIGLPEHRYKSQLWAGMSIGDEISDKTYKKWIDVVGIDGELERLRSPLGKPGGRIAVKNSSGRNVGAEIKLKEWQRHDFIKLMNEVELPMRFGDETKDLTMRKALNEMIRTPAYMAAPDDPNALGNKSDMIRAVAAGYRLRANYEFFRKHPELKMRSMKEFKDLNNIEE